MSLLALQNRFGIRTSQAAMLRRLIEGDASREALIEAARYATKDRYPRAGHMGGSFKVHICVLRKAISNVAVLGARCDGAFYGQGNKVPASKRGQFLYALDEGGRQALRLFLRAPGFSR